MNRLSLERRALILNCLTEGMSQRATARLTGAARNTVSKLAIDAGEAAAEYQNRAFQALDCQIIEADEIWSFVYARRYTTTVNPRSGRRVDMGGALPRHTPGGKRGVAELVKCPPPGGMFENGGSPLI